MDDNWLSITASVSFCIASVCFCCLLCRKMYRQHPKIIFDEPTTIIVEDSDPINP